MMIQAARTIPQRPAEPNPPFPVRGTLMRGSLVLGALLSYIGFLFFTYPYLGPAAGIAAVLPALIVGCCWGFPAGVATSVATITFNLVVGLTAENPLSATTLFGMGGGVIPLILLLTGGVGGWIGERRQRARASLSEHQHLATTRLDSETNFRLLADRSPEAICIHSGGLIQYVNREAARLIGAHTVEQLIGQPLLTFVHPDYHELVKRRTRQVLEGSPAELMEEKLVRLDGVTVDVEVVAMPTLFEGQPAAQVILKDVTARKQTARALKDLALQLTYQSRHDNLTRLPNRLLFEEQLDKAIEYAGKTNTAIAVCLIGVDRFKLVNDTYGHLMGDTLLREIASRLSGMMHPRDILSRVAGDEFAVALTSLGEPDEAKEAAAAILSTFEKPFAVGTSPLYLTVSMGISLFPEDGAEINLLLNKAARALYHAKRYGKNTYHLYSGDLNNVPFKRLEVEYALRHAIEAQQLQLHYQPQLNCGNGTIVIVEALARWNHPEFGVVSPETFIPLAEETGLISALGLWVLKEACSQNRAWQDAGHIPMRVAVNISVSHFMRADFVESVLHALEASGLEGRWLELEVTESLFLHDMPDIPAKLDQLREAGIAIAIDDFGAGYSSLRYLQQLSVDTLKIDRSFVNKLGNGASQSDKTLSIISAVTSLAHSLEMRVVVEGVETESQYDMVRYTGCDRVQGFLCSRPLPAQQIPAFLTAHLSAAEEST